MEEGEDMGKKKDSKKILYFFLKNWYLLIAIAIDIILVSFLATYPIKLLSEMVDIATSVLPGGVSKLIKVGGIYFALQILWSLAYNTLSYLNIYVETKLGHIIRCEVFKHLSYLPQSFYDTNNSGDVMVKLVQDTQVTVQGFLKPITFLAKSLVTFGMGLYFMININWKLTLFVIPLGIVTSLFASKVGGKFRTYSEKSRNSLAKLWFSYQEGLRGMREVQVNCKQDNMLSKISSKSKEANKDVRKEQGFAAFIQSVNSIMFMGVIALITVLGGVLVIKGEITIGGLSAFMMYNGLLIDPLVEIISLYQEMQKTWVSMKKINDIFNEPVSIYKKKAPKSKDIRLGEISFKNVSFSYKDDVPIIKDLNLQINSGEKVAIVGASGAGKSTIFKLILGFYKTNIGEVKVNNLLVDDLNMSYIRDNIAVVFQDTFLFDDTIENNILFSNPSATNEELLKAIEIAQLSPIIENLPEGLKTKVGENGTSLSGGEKQRVGIARALIRKPKILLLDEFISALDNETTSLVIENILKEYDDCTIITIAHRLSTITNMDKIYLMKHGEIVEEGIHDELMKLSGVYRALYESDFS